MFRAHTKKDGAAADAVNDPRLPHLGLALDAACIQERLRPILGARGAMRATCLKHVPGKRAVIAYEFEDGRRAIAKMYRKQRAARHARHWTALQAAQASRTRVPPLLACWEDLGMLLQEWVEGKTFAGYVDLAGDTENLRRMAEALADLHEAAVPAGPIADLRHHLKRTCHPGWERMAVQLPQLGAPLRRIEDEMLRREQATTGGVRPCHGDFGPRQVVLSEDEVYLLDLDGFCHGDPAMDVATFRVGLRQHLQENGNRMAETFTRNYLEARSIDGLPGLQHYEAFAYLRRAMILWRKKDNDWEEGIHLLVLKSQQVLGLG